MRLLDRLRTALDGGSDPVEIYEGPEEARVSSSDNICLWLMCRTRPARMRQIRCKHLTKPFLLKLEESERGGERVVGMNEALVEPNAAPIFTMVQYQHAD